MSAAVQLAAVVQASRVVAGWGDGLVELRPLGEGGAAPDGAARALVSEVEAVSSLFDLRITGDQTRWLDWLAAVQRPGLLKPLGGGAWWVGPGAGPQNAVEKTRLDLDEEIMWVYAADARGLPILGDGTVMPQVGLSPAVGLVATVQALRAAGGWGTRRVQLWPIFDDAARSPQDVAAFQALLSAVEYVALNAGLPIVTGERALWVPARRPADTAMFAFVGADQGPYVFDAGITAADPFRSDPFDDVGDPDRSGFVGFDGKLTSSFVGDIVVSSVPGGIDGPATLGKLASASRPEPDTVSPVLIPGGVPADHILGKWQFQGIVTTPNGGNVSLGPWQPNPNHPPMPPLRQARMLYQILQEIRTEAGLHEVRALVGHHRYPITVTAESPLDTGELDLQLFADSEFVRKYHDSFAPTLPVGWTYHSVVSATRLVGVLFQGDERPLIDMGRLPLDPKRIRMVVFGGSGGLSEATDVAERSLRQLHVEVARKAVFELRLPQPGASTIEANWALEVGKRWRRQRLAVVEVHPIDLDVSVEESGGTPMAGGVQTYPEWARTVQFPPLPQLDSQQPHGLTHLRGEVYGFRDEALTERERVPTVERTMKVDPDKAIFAWVRLREDVPERRPTLSPLVAALGGAPVVLVGEPEMAPIDGDLFLKFERIFTDAGPEATPVRVLVYGQAYAVVERAANQTSEDAARAWLDRRPAVTDLRWGKGPSPRDASRVVVQVPVWMLLPVSGASLHLIGGHVDAGPDGVAGLAIADSDAVEVDDHDGRVEVMVADSSGGQSWAEEAVVAKVRQQIAQGGGAKPTGADDATGTADLLPAAHEAPPSGRTQEPPRPGDLPARGISAADVVSSRRLGSDGGVAARLSERSVRLVLSGLMSSAGLDEGRGWAWLAAEVHLDDGLWSRARALGMRWASDEVRLVALGSMTFRAFGVDGVTVQHLREVRQLVDLAEQEGLGRDWGGLQELVARVRHGGPGGPPGSDLDVRILLELLAAVNRAKESAGRGKGQVRLADLMAAWAEWQQWLLPAIDPDKRRRWPDRVWSLGGDLGDAWARVKNPGQGVVLAYRSDASGRLVLDGSVMPELGVSAAVQLAAVVQASRVVAGWGDGLVELRPLGEGGAAPDGAARALVSEVEAVSSLFDLRITGDQTRWLDWLAAVQRPGLLKPLGGGAWWVGPGAGPQNAVEKTRLDLDEEIMWVYAADARGLPILGDGTVMPQVGLSPAVGLVATVQALRAAGGWGTRRVQLWPIFDDAARSAQDVAAFQALLSAVEYVALNAGLPIVTGERALWVPARRPADTAMFAFVGADQGPYVFDAGITAADPFRSDPFDDVGDPDRSGFVGFDGKLTSSFVGDIVVSSVPGGIDGPATLGKLASASRPEPDTVSPVLIPGGVPADHILGKWQFQGIVTTPNGGNVSLGPWQPNPNHPPMPPLRQARMLYQVLQEIRTEVASDGYSLTVAGEDPPPDMYRLYRLLPLADQQVLGGYKALVGSHVDLRGNYRFEVFEKSVKFLTERGGIPIITLEEVSGRGTARFLPDSWTIRIPDEFGSQRDWDSLLLRQVQLGYQFWQAARYAAARAGSFEELRAVMPHIAEPILDRAWQDPLLEDDPIYPAARAWYESGGDDAYTALVREVHEVAESCRSRPETAGARRIYESQCGGELHSHCRRLTTNSAR